MCSKTHFQSCKSYSPVSICRTSKNIPSMPFYIHQIIPEHIINFPKRAHQAHNRMHHMHDVVFAALPHARWRVIPLLLFSIACAITCIIILVACSLFVQISLSPQFFILGHFCSIVWPLFSKFDHIRLVFICFFDIKCAMREFHHNPTLELLLVLK